MAEDQETQKDPVLTALTSLSDVAQSGAGDLVDINQDLAQMRQHREQGWSWRRIVSDGEVLGSLSLLTKIASDLARGIGGLRRALAVGLHREGMQVTEIASLFEVSRQRVTALIRPRDADERAG